MVASRMKAMSDTHQPVLLEEAIQGLNLRPKGVYVDATFGRGGHSHAILQQLGPTGRLLAMDKDPEAIDFAQQYFAHDPRFTIQQGPFAGLASYLQAQNVWGQVNGILFDLGVSSPQLDNPGRGFSFSQPGPLDMRMDCSQGTDAATLIASLDEKKLTHILWQYGEERFAKRIARAIVAARAERPIQTTVELARIIAAAVPVWQVGKHPATRSFQAIRIAVNNELDELTSALAQSLTALSGGGRLVVMSFHSLEDRTVKQFMQHHERGDPYPAKLPIKYDQVRPALKKIGRSIKPSLREVNRNPRARSAVLRIGEKLS